MERQECQVVRLVLASAKKKEKSQTSGLFFVPSSSFEDYLQSAGLKLDDNYPLLFE